MHPSIIVNGITVTWPECPVCRGPVVQPMRCLAPDELTIDQAGQADFRQIFVCRRHLLFGCLGPAAAAARHRVWAYVRGRRTKQRRATVFRPLTRWARLRTWLARLLPMLTREEKCRMAELRRAAQLRVCYPVWGESEN